LLGRLAQGRPGRALVLSESDGLALYRELEQLIARLPDIEPGKIHALAERLSRPAEEGRYRPAIELLEGFIRPLVESGSGIASAYPDAAASALTGKLLSRASLERWAGLWEKIGHLTRRADALQLDRRQVILSSFDALSSVAGGA